MAEPKATKTKKIKALFIRSVSKQGFRRAGFAFNAEGFGIALDTLTKEQITALRDESNLVVEDSEIEIEVADEPKKETLK